MRVRLYWTATNPPLCSIRSTTWSDPVGDVVPVLPVAPELPVLPVPPSLEPSPEEFAHAPARSPSESTVAPKSFNRMVRSSWVGVRAWTPSLRLKVPTLRDRLRPMSGTMRALRKPAPRPGAELVDIPVPTPGEDEVLVRVHAASICGTDLHIYDWNEWAEKRILRMPMTFGHEVAGTVEAVGSEVHHLESGAFVAAETHVSCGRCSTCRTGRAHICENLRILGVDIEGAFAEYVVIPARERVGRR